MGKTSIECADYTFNHVIGCTKVAAGCASCYAEAFAKRTGKAKCGPQGTRVKTSESYWKQPLKWNREAEAAGEHRRVFCASMADVFEDWQGPVMGHKGSPLVINAAGFTFHVREDWTPCYGERGVTLDDVRRELFNLIDATPHLDWLLLTKRPENILRMTPPCFRCNGNGRVEMLEHCPVCNGRGGRKNVWLGTSIATQADADRNIPLLLECRDLAPVLFLSCEPLLERVTIGDALYEQGYESGGPQGWVQTAEHGIDWIIAGGESGPKARPMHPAWVKYLRDQCKCARVPFHFKQHGEWATDTTEYKGPPLGPDKVRYALPDGSLAELGKGLLKSGTELLYRVGKKAAGRFLDGVEYNEFPEVSHAR